MDEVVEQFSKLTQSHGIELSAVQKDQFETYYQELVEWNEKK